MRLEQQIPLVGVRWTIGDVSDVGFEALRLSIWSAWNLFGKGAHYAVCVNIVPLPLAVARTGELPCGVKWLQASDVVPRWLRPYIGPEMAEGTAWKFAPVRVFPTLHELSLDNDVIFWALPQSMKEWLQCGKASSCLMAADVQSALGQFSAICNHRALNSGIRGLSPGFDMEGRLQKTLVQSGVTLQSELDEQGLQAAVLLQSNLSVVSTEDVSICSPFPNHQRHLGKCGVHFVGLNRKCMPWTLEGRGAHELIGERWDGYRSEIVRLVRMAASARPRRANS
jgi:hypothetical protein